MTPHTLAMPARRRPSQPPVRTAFLPDAFALPVQPDGPEPLDFRQLRHHTKNALQRIMGVLMAAHSTSRSPAERQLLGELERRICLSAAVSDALFGFTAAPAALPDRLQNLAECCVSLLCTPEQSVSATVRVRGACPDILRDTVVRVAHELISNACKHGLHERARGRIWIELTSQPDGASVLRVIDDGWSCDKTPVPGGGLGIAAELLRPARGTLAFRHLAPEATTEADGEQEEALPARFCAEASFPGRSTRLLF